MGQPPTDAWKAKAQEMRDVLIRAYEAVCACGHGEIVVTVARRDGAGPAANPGSITVEVRPSLRGADGLEEFAEKIRSR